MSIQSEITRITAARDSSFTEVALKGVTVPSDATIEALPSLIASIPTGNSPGSMVTQNSAGYVILDPSGNAHTISKCAMKVQSARDSTFTLNRVVYDWVAPVGVGFSGLDAYATSISSGSTVSYSNSALFDNDYIIIHIYYANFGGVTYNGAPATYTSYDSGAHHALYISIPSNFDPDIPFVFS